MYMYMYMYIYIYTDAVSLYSGIVHVANDLSHRHSVRVQCSRSHCCRLRNRCFFYRRSRHCSRIPEDRLKHVDNVIWTCS